MLDLSLITPFLEKILTQLTQAGIYLYHYEIDHLCYRTDSLEHYEKVKSDFSNIAKLLIENDVNGRPIATYKLHQPINFQHWIIDLIEVPAPKPGRKTDRGWEHIEVVIDKHFDDFMAAHPHIKFETKGLSKNLNPELEIEFKDCAVKFHHKSLEHIINIEKNTQIMNFLESSNILVKLRKFCPCLSGTFPLGIDQTNSNLNIIFQAEVFENFLKAVQATFEAFSLTINQNATFVTVNFKYHGLPIELYCENRNVYQQNAHQHCLIEGRLLKILGAEFRQKILDLEISYDELLNLNKLSDAELYRRFKL